MWSIFFRERVPLASYVLLSAGLAASGILLSHAGFATLPFVIASFGLLVFFIELRLMDELKDIDSDRIAHPDRPLPRGIVSEKQTMGLIRLGLSFMAGYAAIQLFMIGTFAGVGYLLVGIYLSLMFKEFNAGHWLRRKPALYALSHQVILVLCCAYTLFMTPPDYPGPAVFGFFSAMVLGSFFSYEICRKLDPHAHPILDTYLAHYGSTKTFLFVAGSIATAAIGASGLGLFRYLAAFYGLLIVSWILRTLAPRRHKVTEGMASLSLLAHVWILPVQALLFSGR